jgi:hypothetical protein
MINWGGAVNSASPGPAAKAGEIQPACRSIAEETADVIHCSEFFGRFLRPASSQLPAETGWIAPFSWGLLSQNA